MTVRRAPRDERGFTLIELMVVMTVLSLVIFALYSLLDGVTRNASRQEAVVINQESVRLATSQIARDLRSAYPLSAYSSGSLYATQFDAAVLSPSGGTLTYIRWQLTGTTLTRSVLSGPGGTVVSSKPVLKNVTDAAEGRVLFRYFSSSGDELLYSATPPASPPPGIQYATVGDFANCTIRVHITLTAAPSLGPTAFAEETDAEIRNRLPGGIGC